MSTSSAQVFATEADAELEIAKLRGWNAEPVKVERDPGEFVWLIECGAGTFLREDGFVA